MSEQSKFSPYTSEYTKYINRNSFIALSYLVEINENPVEILAGVPEIEDVSPIKPVAEFIRNISGYLGAQLNAFYRNPPSEYANIISKAVEEGSLHNFLGHSKLTGVDEQKHLQEVMVRGMETAVLISTMMHIYENIYGLPNFSSFKAIELLVNHDLLYALHVQLYTGVLLDFSGPFTSYPDWDDKYFARRFDLLTPGERLPINVEMLALYGYGNTGRDGKSSSICPAGILPSKRVIQGNNLNLTVAKPALMLHELIQAPVNLLVKNFAGDQAQQNRIHYEDWHLLNGTHPHLPRKDLLIK